MQAEYNPGSGRFAFTHPELPAVFIQGAGAWLSYRLQPAGRLYRVNFSTLPCSVDEEPLADVHGTGHQMVIRCPAGSAGIALVYRLNQYFQQPFVLVKLTVHNQGHQAVYLHEGCLVDAGPSNAGRLQLNTPAQALRFFKVGWHGWGYTGLRQVADRDSLSWIDHFAGLSYTNPQTWRLRPPGEFSSEGWGMLIGDHACLVAGFASTAHQFGQLYACTRPGEAALRLVIQLDGVLLEPGEQRDSEWGYLQLVPLPNPQPEAGYVEAVARQMGARVPVQPPAPMWTHWYQYFHDISEARLLENLQVLREKKASVPFQVVELDDGYQFAWGDWTHTNSKFPHGLEWLATQVKDGGFTPGLWLAPFVVERRSEVARKHPEWLVKDHRGRPISAGFQYNLFTHALDLTHPAVLDHLQQLASQLTQQWGYRILKIDFLNAGALPGVRYNPKLTRAEALRFGLEALRLGAGEAAFLLGCGCPFGPAIGVVDAMRIGPDTAPSWEPYFHWLGWAGPLLKSNPFIPALRNALRHTLDLSSLHRRWWWNDPDCLLVRDGSSRLTGAEVQSAITLVGLSGGLLVSSDDLRRVSPERLRWLSVLVPNLGLNGTPLDRLEREMPSLYQVKVEHNGQAWQLVGLFNWHDHPADLHLRFAHLGYLAGAGMQVFDFWAGQYLGVHETGMDFEAVPAHGCKLLRICEASDMPQLVGDTLHISMGAELSGMRIGEDVLEVGLVEMGRRVEGELWFRSDQVLKQAFLNSQQVNLEARGEYIYWAKITN
jgi:alpha-galactosidase